MLDAQWVVGGTHHDLTVQPLEVFVGKEALDKFVGQCEELAAQGPLVMDHCSNAVDLGEAQHGVLDFGQIDGCGEHGERLGHRFFLFVRPAISAAVMMDRASRQATSP